MDAMEVENAISHESRVSSSDVDIGAIKFEGEPFEGNEGELFEGDLDISIETIRQFYDTQEEGILSTVGSNGMSGYKRVFGKRAAASDRQIWSGGIIPFTYNSSLSAEVRKKIRKAMDEYENTTCLQFIEYSNQSDYIYFTDAKKRVCSSNSIGRRNGRLTINLSRGCQHHRTILHEIGHALGFWHEHTRPDRDFYVEILEENIKNGKVHNFMKRRDKTVDYQGSKYDYSSIMHYRQTAFVNASCSGCFTVDVNSSEYEKQGRPNIGRERHLSKNDIEQTNRLYSCPMPGEQGTLVVYIKNGRNLENTDITSDADPYVKVTAVSSSGENKYKKTLTQSNNLNPIWNEWLYFSNRQWQFFRISVWDDDYGYHSDDPMSMSETIPILNRGRFATGQTHCANTICDGFIKYDYEILKPVCGNLQVNIQYAHNLTDQDGTPTVIEPYVVITAVRPNGTYYSKRTESKQSTANPVWNQLLNMQNGGSEWVAFHVQIWDVNGGSAKSISSPEAIAVFSERNSSIHHCISSSCSSYLSLDYNLTIECNCQNGGTCNCTGCECTCVCENPYTGTQCEHKESHLLVFAYYGSGLPNKDGFGVNTSDPYVEFIAYDVYDESYRMTTQTNHDSESPTWKQRLDFGTRAWKKLDVKVWDEDCYTNEPLSITQTWNLLPSLLPFSVTHARLNAYTGWVRFDYYMST